MGERLEYQINPHVESELLGNFLKEIVECSFPLVDYEFSQYDNEWRFLCYNPKATGNFGCPHTLRFYLWGNASHRFLVADISCDIPEDELQLLTGDYSSTVVGVVDTFRDIPEDEHCPDYNCRLRLAIRRKIFDSFESLLFRTLYKENLLARTSSDSLPASA